MFTKWWWLTRKLKSSNPQRREAAVVALGKIRRTDAVALLVETLVHGEVPRKVTEPALIAQGDLAVPSLLETYGETKDHALKSNIRRILASNTNPQTAAFWLSEIKRGSEANSAANSLRRIAMMAPAAVSDPETVNEVHRLFEKHKIQALAYFLMDVGDPRAIPALVTLILRHEPDDRARYVVVDLKQKLLSVLNAKGAKTPAVYLKEVLSLPSQMDYPYEEERRGYPGMSADGYEPEVIRTEGPVYFNDLHSKAQQLLRDAK